ncbi:MAG TPA: polysulfide reductase NrfD [Smithella sp.]|nr:polysulfide reductase NrfD [Smithella sp.]
MAIFGKGFFISSLKTAFQRVCSGGWLYLFFVAAFGIMLFIGIGSGIHALFIAGSRHAYATSREVPVAILISTYIFFVVGSTGLCLVSSLGHVFGMESFLPLAKRCVYLSIITILSGFLVIGLEIENPFRMAVYNVISPNFSSNIWWMGTLYGFAVVFLTIEFIFLFNEENHHKAVIAGFLGVVTEIAANSNLGGVFAMMNGRPFWYGPYFPVYFILSALITGCAFIIFFFFLAHKAVNKEAFDDFTAKALQSVSKLTLLLLAIMMIFTLWKFLTTSVGSPGAVTALNILTDGSYSFNFWAIEVLGGMVIPFVLILAGKERNLTVMFIASALMIFSLFFTRMDMVVVGQLVPQYFELGVVEYSKLHTYFPSVHEILVVLGGISFCVLAFLLGEKVFSGFAENQQTEHIQEKEPEVVGAEETV